jgi:hypothetical protein
VTLLLSKLNRPCSEQSKSQCAFGAPPFAD